MGILQKGMRANLADFDISTEIMRSLREITEHEIGPFHPSPWFCINFDTNQVGRAYPYRGEYRIVPITPDFGMLQDIDEVVNPVEGQEV